MGNIQNERVRNIVKRNCSGYGSLESTFFLREKLRLRFKLMCNSLAFDPTQFGLNTSRQLITVPPNSFQMSGLLALITPSAMLKICFVLMSPPACRVHIAIFLTFRIKSSSKTFGRNNITVTVPLKLILNSFTDVPITLPLGYFIKNFLMPEEVPNTDACFPASLFKFSEICFWYCFG